MFASSKLPNFWSRVNKTSPLASEIPAISKSFSFIIFPILLSFSKRQAAFLAEALSKEQTMAPDRNLSAACFLILFLCLSNSYSVIVVVLTSSFFEISPTKATIFWSPAKKSIMMLVSRNVTQMSFRNLPLFRQLFAVLIAQAPAYHPLRYLPNS